MSTQRMNPIIKAKWVAALRSGTYTQGTGQLRNADNCFCCLGVLCDLKDGDQWRDNPHRGDYGYVSAPFFDYPPHEVFAWAGLGETRNPQGPEVLINGYFQTVAEHNDMGRTFSEIADAIEEQL